MHPWLVGHGQWWEYELPAFEYLLSGAHWQAKYLLVSGLLQVYT